MEKHVFETVHGEKPRGALFDGQMTLLVVGGTIALALTVTLYGSVLIGWFETLQTDPSYSHGILLPFISCYLAYKRLAAGNGDTVRASARPDWLGVVLLAAGCTLLILGERATIVFLTRLSFLIVIAGLIIAFFGRRLMRALAFPYGLLFLGLPLPALVYMPTAFRLQLLSSAVAGHALNSLGIPALREGNIINLPNASLEVVEACSGIHSLFALAAVASLVGYFFLNSNAKRMLLLIAAIPIAIILNAARVTATGVAVYILGQDAAEGFTHFSMGMLVFGAGCIVILLVASRLSRRGYSREFVPRPVPDSNPTKSPVASRLLAVFAILLFSFLLDRHAAIGGQPQPLREPWASFPLDLGNWHGQDLSLSEAQIQSLGTQDVLLREYQQDGDSPPVAIYVAFFPRQQTGTTMHSPLHCIPGSGWEIEKRMVLPLHAEPHASSIDVNEVVFRKGQERTLVLYWYMEQGQAERSELRGALRTLWNGSVAGRTDGCLIRFSNPIETTTQDALTQQLAFVREALPILMKRFLPGAASIAGHDPSQGAEIRQSMKRGKAIKS